MESEKSPAVYILASCRRGTLYIGVTSGLCSRIAGHKEKRIAGFTKRYGVTQLVHYEFHETMDGAIRREKQLKEWQRAWKIELIEKDNPLWLDLFMELCGPRAEAVETRDPTMSVIPAKAGTHGPTGENP